MKILLIVGLLFLAGGLGFYLLRLRAAGSSLPPLSRKEAEKIAEAYILGNAHDMVLRSGQTQEFDFGFVFFYAPKKFLETGNISDMVPGNGPLVVDKRDRKVHQLTSSTDPREAIEAYGKSYPTAVPPEEPDKLGLGNELPPPWIKYPSISLGSIGWRMGVGEEYWDEWQSWYSGLSEKDRASFQLRFPEPSAWKGFYLRSLSRLREGQAPLDGDKSR